MFDWWKTVLNYMAQPSLTDGGGSLEEQTDTAGLTKLTDYKLSETAHVTKCLI